MADEVLVRYGADFSDLLKVREAIKDVTDQLELSEKASKAAFAGKTLEEQTKYLIQHGHLLEELIGNYKSVGGAIKETKKQMEELYVANKKDSDEYKAKFVILEALTKKQNDFANETKKAFSDTRVFNTMVQGAKGVTAAFSVATGLAASFNSENKELEKTLLKVQGAMATLQGIQELANIATEQGGIKTQLYGLALQAVEFIQERFAVSSAAAWAAVTGGVTLVIAAIGGLIYWLNKEQETEEQIAERKKSLDEADELRKNKVITQIKNRIAEQDNEFKQRMLAAKEETAVLEIRKEQEQALIDNIQKRINGISQAAESIKKSFGEENENYVQLKNQILEGDAQILDAKERIKQIEKQIEDARIAAFERLKKEELSKVVEGIQSYTLKVKKVDFEVKSLDVKPDEVKMEKLPEVEINAKIGRLSGAEAAQQFITEFSNTLNTIAPTVNAFGNLAKAIYSAETDALEQEKQKQLALVGDNAKKREQIEKQYAIKRAKIAREQAIADRALASFQAIVNMASAISKTLADNGLPAAIPYIALAAVTGAAEIAAINVAPLPAIPTFEKGGPVALAGGRIDNGYLIGRSHREGGILIEAQGDEYIWSREAVKAHGDLIDAANNNRLEDLVLHKYVAPALVSAAPNSVSDYDDFELRNTIRRTADKNTDKLIKGITQGVSASVGNILRNNNRYQ